MGLSRNFWVTLFGQSFGRSQARGSYMTVGLDDLRGVFQP